MTSYSSILIASDAHANPQALSDLIKHAESQGPISRRLFLGDAIGYGDDPAAVLKLLKQFDVCILGNHELLALDGANREAYSKGAAKTVSEHVELIGSEGLRFLSRFLPRYELGRCMFFHGTPDSALDYPFNDVEIRDILRKHPDPDMFFGGHLHIPRLAMLDKATGAIQFEDIAGSKTCFQLDWVRNKYFVNCPSATPGRFGFDSPGCCLLRLTSEDEGILEYLFLK